MDKPVRAPDHVQRIFRAKEEFHRDQAKLPIEEKIRILVQLQKMAVAVQGKTQKAGKPTVWQV